MPQLSPPARRRRGRPLPAIPIGFTLDEAVPYQRFALRGRHWFSSYRPVFVLTDVTHDPSRPRTRVVAETWAEFPGIKGRVGSPQPGPPSPAPSSPPRRPGWRALVIGTRAHRIVVRQMLKDIAAKAHSHTLAMA